MSFYIGVKGNCKAQFAGHHQNRFVNKITFTKVNS